MAQSAAWLTAPKARPLAVKPTPAWSPAEHEILLKNHAIAVNPVDNSLQSFPWMPLEYPSILGEDVAGEVVAIGSGILRFKIGDRVVGHALGIATKRPEHGGYQTHTVLLEHMASVIPSEISYEQAVVIPHALSTAACGLFQEPPYLHLQLPTEPSRTPVDETILIWGGASSVGGSGIQLARAAGYEIVTTASPKNFDYVRRLGASAVFDYKSPTVKDDLVKALTGKKLVGVLHCVGDEGLKISAEVLQRVAGQGRIASTKGGNAVPDGIVIGRIFGLALKDNVVGPSIYVDFLPQALAKGSFVPAPSADVAGNGLEVIQAAMDRLKQGVSARKIVVTL